MKRPKYSDFKLDYDKFPKYMVGGIADMNVINRQNHKDAMFELAEDKWMDEAEQKIKEFKKYTQHLNTCNKNYKFGDNECTCGLDKLLKS